VLVILVNVRPFKDNKEGQSSSLSNIVVHLDGQFLKYQVGMFAANYTLCEHMGVWLQIINHEAAGDWSPVSPYSPSEGTALIIE
jgi:hypothetical protein